MVVPGPCTCLIVSAAILQMRKNLVHCLVAERSIIIKQLHRGDDPRILKGHLADFGHFPYKTFVSGLGVVPLIRIQEMPQFEHGLPLVLLLGQRSVKSQVVSAKSQGGEDFTQQFIRPGIRQFAKIIFTMAGCRNHLQELPIQRRHR